jgi:hypothetical protein
MLGGVLLWRVTCRRLDFLHRVAGRDVARAVPVERAHVKYHQALDTAPASGNFQSLDVFGIVSGLRNERFGPGV